MIVRPMDIVIVGHNYAPELIGIGPCTAGMAETLAASGNRVRVICGQPSYPSWRVAKEHRSVFPRRTIENNVAVRRLPLYVPANPRGLRRMLHNLSFAVLALIALIVTLRRGRPEVIIAIVPSIASALVARLVAWLCSRPLWLHVQDFEVDMASATGQLRHADNRLLRRVERSGLHGTRASSISPRMCDRLVLRGNDRARVIEFRNWASPHVRPLSAPSVYRAQWSINRPFVALYSGNIAAKQGIEIVVEAAKRLAGRRDLLFVICGEGAHRAALLAATSGCDNILFCDLQPAERLNDLLGLATVHLLPQIADAADLVLPSKLPNMLASGRPVVATASAGTSLAEEVDGCGIVTPPHDAPAFARAIETLIDDAVLRDELGRAALERAAIRWNKSYILADFERELRRLDAEWRAERLSWDRSFQPGLGIGSLAE
ncbi:WcaI family glycosyltransferase [Sphingomonas radiodurans]|uniref:WcaI family glycosyltransferase n=1 Tax=Sphingomonas radiodurans TaxID=2890321 RepID=UPI001E31DE86|nr:WcaI family glycosyltransferase [Sphingomonas radiodurans]WBH17904.1 WcaI family glycosyltransferase [Sphingomonas radiodurans]